uniref:Uncharacterized protein n=1 Tax=Glycine max TaxID=3847 RepID=A0A0R0KRC9_SOYBN
MGAKYLEVVKRGSHPNKGWSLDEIRTGGYKVLNYEFASGESHKILDVDILACVLQLINICGSGFHSKSRRGSNIVDDWDKRHHIVKELKAMLMQRKEVSTIKRDKTLSQAFSQQIWRNGRTSSIGNEDELEERPKWLHRWMATKP